MNSDDCCSHVPLQRSITTTITSTTIVVGIATFRSSAAIVVLRVSFFWRHIRCRALASVVLSMYIVCFWLSSVLSSCGLVVFSSPRALSCLVRCLGTIVCVRLVRRLCPSSFSCRILCVCFHGPLWPRLGHRPALRSQDFRWIGAWRSCNPLFIDALAVYRAVVVSSTRRI